MGPFLLGVTPGRAILRDFSVMLEFDYVRSRIPAKRGDLVFNYISFGCLCFVGDIFQQE